MLFIQNVATEMPHLNVSAFRTHLSSNIKKKLKFFVNVLFTYPFVIEGR